MTSITEKTVVTLTILAVCGLGFACSLISWLGWLLLAVMIAAGVVGIGAVVARWRHINQPSNPVCDQSRPRDVPTAAGSAVVEVA
jgi:hypothetical protein